MRVRAKGGGRGRAGLRVERDGWRWREARRARELCDGLGADRGQVAVGEQVDGQAAVGELLLEAARPLVAQEHVDAEEACRG